jgi:DNA-binding CsgD family transcriptional regulator
MNKELEIPRSQRNQPHGQEVVIADRRLKAIRLRRDGKTMREIADILGCSTQTISTDISHTLKKLVALNAAETAEFRELELARIDSLLEVLIPRSLAGNLWACDRVLTCISMRSKLLGLDRPVKHEITGEIGVEHTHSVDDQLMARMRRLAGLSSESDPKNDEAKQIESTPAQELCADGEICQNPGGCNCK